jgi:SNase-like nuclease
MKRIIFLILGVFCCCSVSAQDLPNEFYAKVVGVSDGDTFKVLYQENQEIKVRLNHIDAPEKGQPFGKNAKKFASDLCFGKEVKIVRQKKKDRYQRIIAEVFVGQTNINKEIVRAGYAWHFKKYSSDREYDEIETEARENKRGLWQDKNPVAPWTWREIKKQKRALEKSTPF